MSAIGFAWPWCFLALPLPWLLRRLLPPVAGVALRMPSLPPAAADVTARVTASTWIAALAWLLLVTAAARPQVPGQLLAQEGRDMMLAVDVSASMATRDLLLDGRPVERLQAARSIAGDFIRRREAARADRIGLVVFGTQAYLHTPPSFDLHAVRAALDTAETGLAGHETALGDAIALATKHLSALPDQARVLVLLSDGANTAGTLAPLRAAWLAQRENVRIHAVGIGAGAELDETTLKGIAEQTGGVYLRATDAAAIGEFFRSIERLEAAAHGAPPLRRAQELYAWPLGLAFVLACGLALRRTREVRT